jgi:hypothetical protein
LKRVLANQALDFLALKEVDIAVVAVTHPPWSRLRELAAEYPRYGYRRLHALLEFRRLGI